MGIGEQVRSASIGSFVRARSAGVAPEERIASAREVAVWAGRREAELEPGLRERLREAWWERMGVSEGDSAARIEAACRPEERSGEVLLARRREEIERVAGRYALVGVWTRLRLLDGWESAPLRPGQAAQRRELAAAIDALADLDRLYARMGGAFEIELARVRDHLEARAERAAVQVASLSPPAIGPLGEQDSAARMAAHFAPMAADLRRSDPWWTWDRIGSLVLESSADWTTAPCPRAVVQWRRGGLVDALRAAG
jgi:hypothetical protein